MRWRLCLIFPLLANAAGKSPKEVVALWRALPKLAKSTPDKAYRGLHTWLPNRGLRGLYAKAQFALNLAQLQKISGHKIFGAGPHANGQLNLKSPDDFGRYNPAFLKWAATHGIPGRTDAKLRKELQPVYDKFLRRTARGYFAAHQIVMANLKRLKKIQAEYSERLDGRKGAGDFLQESFRPDADRLDKAGHDWYETNVAHGFWVRRALDGTDDECHALLTALLQTHDAAWLKKQNPR